MSHLRIESELIIETRSAERRVREAQQFLNIPLTHIHTVSCYLFSAPLSKETLLERFQKEWKAIFVDSVLEKLHTSSYNLPTHLEQKPNHVVEVGFRPGVTDNVARSAEEALLLCSDIPITVATAKLYYLFGTKNKEQAQKIAQTLLGNVLIQSIQVWSTSDFENANRFEEVQLPTVHLQPFTKQYETIDITRSIEI